MVREGDNTFAWRMKGDTLQKVKLDLGVRDARTGQYAVKEGLAEGDTVLRYPGSTLKDGQPAQLVGTAQQSTMAAEK